MICTHKTFQNTDSYTAGKDQAQGWFLLGGPCILHSGGEYVYSFLISWDLGLQGTEIQNGGLINLVEEITKQSSAQAVAWVLLSIFSQIYNKSQEKQEQLKQKFGQKGSSSKIEAYKAEAGISI